MSIEAFPLAWPIDWPRTKNRQRAPYSVSGDVARKELERELKLLHARKVIISTNVPLRMDGKPYAGSSERRYDDPGVAVYFERDVKGQSHPQVIACDKWLTVHGNVRAVGLAVAGLRAVLRSGASELLDRAFTGFKALPQNAGASTSPQWWDVLGVPHDYPDDYVEAKYHELARKHHPDFGGDVGAMAVINRAYEQFQSERGL
jgi:hypothetical protein